MSDERPEGLSELQSALLSTADVEFGGLGDLLRRAVDVLGEQSTALARWREWAAAELCPGGTPGSDSDAELREAVSFDLHAEHERAGQAEIEVARLREERDALLAALREGDRLYTGYGLLAQPMPGDALAAGRWASSIRDLLQKAALSAPSASETSRG